MTHTLESVYDWLGDAAIETTTETCEDIAAAWRQLEEIIPDADDQLEACQGAATYLLGDATVAELGEALARARAEQVRASAALRGAIVAATRAGEPVAQLARAAGITRATVYAYLGR